MPYPAIPPLRPIFVRNGPGREAADHPGAWSADTPTGARTAETMGWVSQVPEEPFGSFALFSDPGPTGLSLGDQVLDSPTRPPLLTRARAQCEDISGLNGTGFDLTVYALQCQLPAPTQDSLPAAGPTLPDGIEYPQGSNERFQAIVLPPLPSFLAQCQSFRLIHSGMRSAFRELVRITLLD